MVAKRGADSVCVANGPGGLPHPAAGATWAFSTLVDSGLSLQVVVAVVLDAPGAALSLVRIRAGI